MLRSAAPDELVIFMLPLINHPASIGSPNALTASAFALVLVIAS